jgi:hypothetical protein
MDAISEACPPSVRHRTCPFAPLHHRRSASTSCIIETHMEKATHILVLEPGAKVMTQLLPGGHQPRPARAGALEAASPPPEVEEAAGLADTPAHLTDLTCPASWYPAARQIRRRVVAHLGPTNSGKTHAALAQLKAAPSGVYCGPLRLLASEVRRALHARRDTVSAIPFLWANAQACLAPPCIWHSPDKHRAPPPSATSADDIWRQARGARPACMQGSLKSCCCRMRGAADGGACAGARRSRRR